ncbi:hypothetical protein [Coxiella-like endosymbiont]|uniref:hypothetical protein n=1 Tax=Coxiella-like endosymbiont TaxID=1592897 RepID=UPI0027297005|nr:hypothetical protein [Coxiella-like endosymbiont]
MVSLIGSVYLGYAPTFWRTIVEVIWRFMDGFISGVIFCLLFIMLANACSGRCMSQMDGIDGKKLVKFTAIKFELKSSNHLINLSPVTYIIFLLSCGVLLSVKVIASPNTARIS